ncbi:MAG: hypothetical protein HY744_26145 [Deltaproteobacteria bacterium]|nr:hypothetical protein [Deltaproteobacteria bacterium]
MWTADAMTEFALIFGIIVSLMMVAWVIRDLIKGQLPWPTRRRVVGLEGLLRDNLLKHTNEEALIFSGCLHGGLGDHPEFAREIAASKARVQFLFGPDVDVRATAMLKAITRNPHVEAFLISNAHRSDVQCVEPGDGVPSWRFQHFLVGDRKHVTVEARHALSPGTKPLEYHEIERDPGCAEEYADQFELMCDEWAVPLDRQCLVKGIQRHGQFLSFDAEGRPSPADAEVIAALEASLGANQD